MKNTAILLGVLILAGVWACSSRFTSSSEYNGGYGSSEPTAAGLWSDLKRESYRMNWRMWPGKDAFYPGREPHGALLTTYVNGVARMGIEQKAGILAPGSTIVKENYSPQEELVAITVMYKRKGYNPAAGDWFWAKYGPDGAVQAEGKVNVCIGCHGGRASNDYLWTSSIR